MKFEPILWYEIRSNIKLVMSQRKVTTAWIAKQSGINRGQISKLLNNQFQNPTIQTIERIALVLGVKPIDLLK